MGLNLGVNLILPLKRQLPETPANWYLTCLSTASTLQKEGGKHTALRRVNLQFFALDETPNASFVVRETSWQTSEHRSGVFAVLSTCLLKVKRLPTKRLALECRSIGPVYLKGRSTAFCSEISYPSLKLNRVLKLKFSSLKQGRLSASRPQCWGVGWEPVHQRQQQQQQRQGVFFWPLRFHVHDLKMANCKIFFWFHDSKLVIFRHL